MSPVRWETASLREMLTLAAGRERTEAEWRALLEASGWEPARFGEGVIEARPCR